MSTMSIIRRLILWLIIPCCIIFIGIYAYYYHSTRKSDKSDKLDSDLYFHSDQVLQGNNKVKRGEYAAAISDFDAAILSDPDDAVAYFYRGRTKFLLNRFFAATSDFDTAIRLNPEYSEAYHLRGRTLVELNKFSMAIRDYTDAIRLNPKYVEAYYARGRAYMDSGKSSIYFDPKYSYNIDEAISDFSTVIELDSEHVPAYVSRGLAHERKYSYSDSSFFILNDYNTAIQIAPDYPLAYYYRSLYRERFRSGTLEAKEDMQTALKLAEQAWGVERKEEMEKAYRDRIDREKEINELFNKYK